MSRKFVYYGAGRSADELLLDLYPATAAYSLRKLRTAYTGSAIRVRRSSDNAEQDIGFDGVDLDTTSLLSFVGSGNAFVTTWYDQQGSENATQISSSAQPSIVLSGDIITENVKPAINFDGIDDFLDFTNTITGTSNRTSISVVKNDVENGTVGGNSILALDVASGTTGGRWIQCMESGDFYVRTLGNARFSYASGMDSLTYSLITLTFSGTTVGDIKPYQNGNELIKISDTGAVINTGTDGIIGRYVSGVFQNGRQQEIIIFNTDESANRTSIEANINTYYDIY